MIEVEAESKRTGGSKECWLELKVQLWGWYKLLYGDLMLIGVAVCMH